MREEKERKKEGRVEAGEHIGKYKEDEREGKRRFEAGKQKVKRERKIGR